MASFVPRFVEPVGFGCQTNALITLFFSVKDSDLERSIYLYYNKEKGIPLQNPIECMKWMRHLSKMTSGVEMNAEPCALPTFLIGYQTPTSLFHWLPNNSETSDNDVLE